ncbi:hypothetical protein F4804DRAFT_61592 [Jackrogersella minutella]|nr:hypothetical protein F4804DRAFT_61592 [Jackrogersella minutella]
MMSGADFYAIHTQLQKARERFDEDFGGMPILILSGDFYQFEPVEGMSLLYPGRATSMKTYQETGELFHIDNRNHFLGHSLWKKFTTVVLLDQQMRATDTMYADILKRLRHGTQTADDADVLNQRLARLTDIHLHQSCKAITPLNKMRHGINLQAYIAFAKR